MQISIINDCFDENAKLRQISRACSLFEDSAANVFAAKSELEAGGLLIDALDSFGGREGVILVNVAPRNGSAKKFKNGTPFGYFWHGKTLVVSSVDGLTLSLCKKFAVIKDFYIFDIEDVMNFISDDELSREKKDQIINTQFRSLNFVPRVANWIWNNYNLPKNIYKLEEISDISNAVWFIDNFGNIKTTIVKKEIEIDKKGQIEIKIKNKKKTLKFYNRLKDLPDGELGIIEGSSGLGSERFLEINIQGGSAASELGVSVGDSISV